jgi:SAM-dependent methyltransferase
MKKEAFEFFNSKKEVEHYNDIYGDMDFSNTYPANSKRLDIFLSIINEINPKKIIDAGCGNGMPIVAMLKKGYLVEGYDKSENMLIQAKKNIVKNGFNANIVDVGNFENPIHLENDSVDCITGMGVFYYSKNMEAALIKQVSKLTSGGSMIFSLRNKLFDLATVNEYTSRFLYELYDIKNKDKNTMSKFDKLAGFYDKPRDNLIKTIDNSNVYSSVHNPLNIDNLLKRVGLKKKSIYFYHYHALPPIFESYDPVSFRELSWSLEDSNDWRGHFLASNFIVHAIKTP